MRKLENKVVFITGGNSAIGVAISLESAREGAIVVVADLDGTDHHDTLKDIIALGARCLFMPTDIADVNSVKEAIKTTVQKFGRLDVAFNFSGKAGYYSEIHNLSEDVWLKTITQNLTSQFYCIKYELQQFLKQGGGVIINMLSLAGLKAEPGLIAFIAATHGVLGMTQNIACQYDNNYIRANSICAFYPEKQIHVGQEIKISTETNTMRPVTTEEIAKAFIFLASGDSSYCNGIQLILDGGIMK